MIYLVTAVHVIVCLFLIGVVLLQTGKRADLAGAFGGGGSQTAFGTRGAATFLTKLTTAFAVMFMVTTITLSVLSNRAASGAGTVLDQVPASSGTPADSSGGLPPADDAAPATEDDGMSDDGTSDDGTSDDGGDTPAESSDDNGTP